MADGLTVRIDGLKELDAALAELSKATAANALYKALFAAAVPMDERWRALAPVGPVRHGKHPHKHLNQTGGVAKSGAVIGNTAYYGELSSSGDKGAAVVAKRDALRASSRSFAEITIGPGRAPQAIWSEFGTSNQPARPYFRPAWDATKDEALRILVDQLKIEVEKSADRARAKALRAR